MRDKSSEIEVVFWPSVVLFGIACLIEFVTNALFLFAIGKELWEVSFSLSWLLFCNILLILLIAYASRDRRFSNAFLKLVLRGADIRAFKRYVFIFVVLSVSICGLDALIFRHGSLGSLFMQGLLMLYILCGPFICRKLDEALG